MSTGRERGQARKEEPRNSPLRPWVESRPGHTSTSGQDVMGQGWRFPGLRTGQQTRGEGARVFSHTTHAAAPCSRLPGRPLREEPPSRSL